MQFLLWKNKKKYTYFICAILTYPCKYTHLFVLVPRTNTAHSVTSMFLLHYKNICAMDCRRGWEQIKEWSLSQGKLKRNCSVKVMAMQVLYEPPKGSQPIYEQWILESLKMLALLLQLRTLCRNKNNPSNSFSTHLWGISHNHSQKLKQTIVFC